MLLRHKYDICDVENNNYYNDDIFQMRVKNLTPEVLYAEYDTNEENHYYSYHLTKPKNSEFEPLYIYKDYGKLIQAFVKTIVNYSPISINIIDYWNKETDIRNPSVYKPEPEPKPKKKPEEFLHCFAFWGGEEDKSAKATRGFGNFADYIDPNDIPFGQFPGIDPFEKYIPQFDENGDPVLDEDGNQIIDYQPHAGMFSLCNDLINDYEFEKDNCGFYLNSLIGLQDELAKINMNHVYDVSYKVKYDTVFRNRINSVLFKSRKSDTKIMNNVVDLFTEESFIINGTWAHKKGQEVSMKYAAKQAYVSELQPKEVQNKFKFLISSKDPMTYEVDGSIMPCIFESFIKPLSHPIGYIYDYKMICDEIFTEYVFGYRTVEAKEIKVISFCSANYDPCCNYFPKLDENGNKILDKYGNVELEEEPRPPHYLDPQMEYDCTRNSHLSFGRWYVIATDDGYRLWDKLDDELIRDRRNKLKDVQRGIVKDNLPNGLYKDYVGWTFIKYIFENNNYLIEFNRPQLYGQSLYRVIEYWRNDVDYYYCYARWNNETQSVISMTGYREVHHSYLEELSTFEVEMKPGRPDDDPDHPITPDDGARWFGFEDNPENSDPNTVPVGWVYYGNYPPGTDPNLPCKVYEDVDFCETPIRFGNKGFANFGDSVYPPEMNLLDPDYIAGVFKWHELEYLHEHVDCSGYIGGSGVEEELC